ncbi:hypothetical protein FI667_g9890, partial [Globisporangium splendens]
MYTATQARKANASIGHVGSTANEQRSRTVLAVSQTVDDWDNYFGVLDEHDEPTCGQQLGHVEKADLSCSNPECSQVVQSSVQHLFWECPKAKLVWNYFYALWAKIGITPGHDLAIWIFSLDLPHTPRHAWTTIKRHIIGHKCSNQHLQDHLYPVAHMLWRYMSASLIQSIWCAHLRRMDSDPIESTAEMAIMMTRLEAGMRNLTRLAEAQAGDSDGHTVAAVLKAYVDCFLSQTDAIPLTPSDTRGVYLLFFDGGSRGNPGPGGTGSIITSRRLADCIDIRGWYNHYRAFNKMADSAANLAMDTRTSTQVHFPTHRATFNNLTQDLDNDVMHWLMRNKDASGVTDPLARNETINWPVPRHFRSQRRVILDERVFLNDSKSNVDKMLAVPGVAGRHRADKTVHLALQLEDIAKRYECLQSVDEKTMSDVPIDDDACMQLDTHSALKMSTLKITISGLRSSSLPRKRLTKFLNTILITGKSRKQTSEKMIIIQYILSLRRESAALDEALASHGFIDAPTADVYRWMEWVIERNLPLSEVDDPRTRAIARMSPISSKSLKKYIKHVGVRVGIEITAAMGNAFGLMFDGWTCGSAHYVGIYAVFAHGGVRHQPLLSLSPMESGQSADAHIEMIDNVLRLYEKQLNMVLFIVVDNCATNQAIAAKLSILQEGAVPNSPSNTAHTLVPEEAISRLGGRKKT